jgi:hypothetical protein
MKQNNKQRRIPCVLYYLKLLIHYYRTTYPKRLITAGLKQTGGDTPSLSVSKETGSESDYHHRFLLK